jgi:hypothetical protein
LRLDLAEGADPAEVSRRVARLLQDRMGLDAAMKGDAAAPPPAPPAPASSSTTRPVSPASRPVASPSRPVAPPPRPVASPPRPVASPPRPVSPAAAAISAPPVPAERVERTTRAGPGETTERIERIARPEPPDRNDEQVGVVVPADVDTGPARPLYPGEQPGPRIVIENVHVNTFGTDASVAVRLGVGGRTASGEANGPAVDGYLLRLCAMATAGAVDQVLATSQHPDGPARCFVEHAAAVPFGRTQVAVVVLLLSCNGWVEQLAGSAVVTGDDRHAMVRATLAAVNRRLEALLSR